MGTLVVGGLVIGAVALAVRSIMKDKRNGKSSQCGESCKSCSGRCH